MSGNATPAQYPELPPHVFIGSSSEALRLAHRIGEELRRGQEFDVKVWDQNVLQSGQMLLEGLRRSVSLFDFVILLLSADDIVESREEREHAPRDNVIFELGMFMGVLGLGRAFPVVVLDRESPLKLPTDVAGLLYTRLDKDKIDDSAHVAEKVAEIREQIKQRSKSAPLSLLPSTGLAYGYFNNFLIPVKEGLSELTNTKHYSKKEIEEGKYIFWILHPQSASEASVVNRDECVKKLALESVSIKYKGRSYPFFVYPERDEKGQVQFADYPTTLRSSSDAIDLVLRQGEIGEFAEEKERLERKEVTNFIKALRLLLKDVRAIGNSFPAKVRFQQ